MVRCKSLVEATRVQIVEVMSKEVPDEETEAETGDETDVDAGETDADTTMGGGWDDDENDEHNMDVARVYEKTLVQLGEALSWGTVYDADKSG